MKIYETFDEAKAKAKPGQLVNETWNGYSLIPLEFKDAGHARSFGYFPVVAPLKALR